ncbi:hypothetical protein [Streptomyces lycii]|uniref:Flp pilus assembly protein CpaB n=1 Tax=Streptomyces lycii TaxID=2654337 RepID=A0ABQ7F8M9_9ACTN|nr:hypothetical protein [Streptomyces lycii]KAF4405101.1 hypothetical protein GCU69_32155 [Streptomyces lycii]
MKTQERTASGGGRAGGSAQPVGERLPSAPRERKPALAALAVLLILVGALGATVLVLRAGERIEVVKITEEVPVGKPVPASAMESVMVAQDSGVDYVKWAQKDLVTEKYRTATPLVEGSLLVGSMLTDESGLPEGKVVVGLSLKGGQFYKGIKSGDTVSAFRVGTDTGDAGDSETGSGGATSGNNLLVQQATVREVTTGSDETISSGDLPVSVLVSQEEAEALTQAAAAGEVAVVQVPSGSADAAAN